MMEMNLENCVEFLHSKCNKGFKIDSSFAENTKWNYVTAHMSTKFLSISIRFSPSLAIYLWSERLSCDCEARVEKLSALNFRLVSWETWKIISIHFSTTLAIMIYLWEKLSALNFRLVSPKTWKSWRWVSGNQELPPDFHFAIVTKISISAQGWLQREWEI